MALNQIKIKKNGGPVTVEIAFGHSQVGAYSLVIWGAGGKGKTQLGEGVNTDQVPDIFYLSQPNEKLNGKILDCLATVIAPNAGKSERYKVDMIVRQDGQECGRESDEGPINSKSVTTRLAAIIVC